VESPYPLSWDIVTTAARDEIIIRTQLGLVTVDAATTHVASIVTHLSPGAHVDFIPTSLHLIILLSQ
jgi:hypothetical protein